MDVDKLRKVKELISNSKDINPRYLYINNKTYDLHNLIEEEKEELKTFFNTEQ